MSEKKNSGLRPYESSHCTVYVLELDSAVANEPAFSAANPHWTPGMPCLYVGMTSLPIEERYRQHLSGSKNSSRMVRRYGIGLRPDLTPVMKPVRKTLALQKEKRIARRWRLSGFAVWQA